MSVWPTTRVIGCGLVISLSGLVACRMAAVPAVFPGSQPRGAAIGDKTSWPTGKLQTTVMRYADEYTSRTAEVSDQLIARAQNARARARINAWKVTNASAAYAIATGQNPTLNLLDMVVLVSLNRSVFTRHWPVEQFGVGNEPLVEVLTELERQIWGLAELALSDEQRQALRVIVDQWIARHPEVRYVTHIRFLDFSEMLKQESGRSRGAINSLLNLAFIDPLSGLDPAMREIEQTRYFAERTLFYLQRMPHLLRWQMRSLALDLAAMEEVQDLQLQIEQFNATASEFTAVLDGLPDQLADAQGRILEQAADDVPLIAELLPDLRQSLESVERTASIVQEIINTQATKQAETPVTGAVDAPADPVATLDDYRATAQEIGTTAQELTDLLLAFQESPAAMSALGTETERAGRGVIDHAFWRLVQLVVVLVVAVLVVLWFQRRRQ